MKWLDDFPVFVTHYTPLTERKALLSAQLAREGLADRTTWLEEFDREAISDYPELDVPGNRLSKAVVALGLSHLESFRRLLASPHGYALMFEDDAILEVGTAATLRAYWPGLPVDWDLLFISAGPDLHVPWWQRRPGKHIYRKGAEAARWGGDGATRCTDAYFFTRRAAEALLRADAYQRPFRKPMDWAMNDAIRQMDLRVYWMEPTPVTQGSEVKRFTRSY